MSRDVFRREPRTWATIAACADRLFSEYPTMGEDSTHSCRLLPSQRSDHSRQVGHHLVETNKGSYLLAAARRLWHFLTPQLSLAGRIQPVRIGHPGRFACDTLSGSRSKKSTRRFVPENGRFRNNSLRFVGPGRFNHYIDAFYSKFTFCRSATIASRFPIELIGSPSSRKNGIAPRKS